MWWHWGKEKKNIGPFGTASRRAVRPTGHPFKWEPGALSSELKRPLRENDHSPASSF